MLSEYSCLHIVCYCQFVSGSNDKQYTILLKALILVKRNTVHMIGGIFRSKVKDSV